MGFKATDILYYLFHPSEVRAIVQWTTWHQPVHERNPAKESEALQRCFYYLDRTSRSFSAVIKELHPELLAPVALFYLILRGLDTIEDDMTIPLDTKDPLLRNFHTTIEKKGWNFDGSGPNEKDRDLLVEFHVVIEEFCKIKPAYRTIIADITRKMGNGMADYCNNAEYNANGVNTVEDYDLYCHYVAGLVGEGLTRLFVEAELGNPLLLERPHLHESMGLFLQKTNIIRDIKEDSEDKRKFWPKEIWSKHVDKFEDLFKPENRQKALDCSSDMILDALGHVDECLFYLAGLKEQSVFNFCAIPQAMAIATLELCFQDHSMFERNVKITKGQTCRIMVDSTQNLRKLSEVFRKYVRKILVKNKPRTHNYKEITEACLKIEKFIDDLFPPKNPSAAAPAPTAQSLQEQAEYEESKRDTFYMLILVMGILFLLSTIMLGIAWSFGARFDLISEDVKKGEFLSRFGDSEPREVKHGEL